MIHFERPTALRRTLVGACCGLTTTLALAQGIELYDVQRFGGERLTLEAAAGDLAEFGFKDRTNSVIVRKGQWEVCERPQFRGTCLTLSPGTYETMPTALTARIASVRPLAGNAALTAAPGFGAPPVPIGQAPAGAPVTAIDEAPPLTLYRDAGFGGRSVPISGALANLGSLNFNDEASSLEIRRGRWQLCQNSDFGGQCMVLGAGRHELSGRFHDGISSLRPVFGPQDKPLPAGGGVLLYEDIDFNGRELLRTEATRNLGDFSFNDRVSSLEVLAGRWELCSNSDFGGTCLMFSPGRYRLDSTLGDRVSSLRPR